MTIVTREAYDAWHRAQGFDDGNAPWHQLLKSLLTDLGGRRVLEIACGTGGFTAWLAGLPPGCRPAEVVASDFSPIAVAMAEELGRSRGVANVSFRIGDVMELDWENESFDVVVSCETIEHVAKPRIALGELARVLRRGGRLYLTSPNYLNLMGLYRLYLRLRGRRFSEGGQPIAKVLVFLQVCWWVRRAGLRIEKTVGAGHYVPWPGRAPIRLQWADRLGPGAGYVALHTLIVARKP
jgi:SAM-dependent methyltransferase